MSARRSDGYIVATRGGNRKLPFQGASREFARTRSPRMQKSQQSDSEDEPDQSPGTATKRGPELLCCGFECDTSQRTLTLRAGWTSPLSAWDMTRGTTTIRTDSAPGLPVALSPPSGGRGRDEERASRLFVGFFCRGPE
jgi:hypothetical protein